MARMIMGFQMATRCFLGGKQGQLHVRPNLSQNRSISILIKWFNRVFNAVDKKRRKLIGPNLTCAEWLLRNGAEVRFKGHSAMISDYNELMLLEELEESKHYKVEEIYAKDVSLSRLGKLQSQFYLVCRKFAVFEHLDGCNHVQKMTFILCNQLDIGCLDRFAYVKDSLEHLEIRACFNVTDKAVLTLVQLKNLNILVLKNLASVEDKAACEAELKKGLPNCRIHFMD